MRLFLIADTRKFPGAIGPAEFSACPSEPKVEDGEYWRVDYKGFSLYMECGEDVAAGVIESEEHLQNILRVMRLSRLAIFPGGK